jgi:hypothetical protein
VIECAECRPSSQNGSHVPNGVVNCGDSATVSWVRHFSDEKGACGVADVTAHAHDESASKKHGVGIACLRASLDRCSKNDKTAANSCSETTTAVISNVGSEEKNRKSSKSGECTKESKMGTSWVMEDYKTCQRRSDLCWIPIQDCHAGIV